MITVIIPTLNEEETIASVVRFAWSSPAVSEVLVVDDKSIDRTVSVAAKNKAKVVTSTKLGKGASMKEGVMYATNEIVVFLDGDIDPYPPQTIELLTDPILKDEAEFVKSSFGRNAGRVTELVAKPLLSIFFPELSEFNQPLSGMIAGKKSILSTISFRDDYGVDIGILIDMYLMKIKTAEVDIGYIHNKSRPLQALGKMSKEVSQTIILKASSTNNPFFNFEELGVLAEIRSQMDFALQNHLSEFNKIIIFDMDDTLLMGRFINKCAEHFGFKNELMNIRANETDTIIITKRIANLIKGKNISELLNLADEIPVVEDAKEVIAELKNRGYIIGIISDSYDCITNHLKNKLGVDFSLANELEFSKSICTGEVKIPSFFFNRPESICKHQLCKTNAVLTILEKYKITKENSIVIGDSMNDLCMIKEAGLGISFCSKDELVNHHADLVFTSKSFTPLLEHAK